MIDEGMKYTLTIVITPATLFCLEIGIFIIYNLGSMLTEDGRCTCEIKSRIVIAKAAFNKKKNLFTSKLDLNLRKKLVKCYVWSMALYGAEAWTRLDAPGNRSETP